MNYSIDKEFVVVDERRLDRMEEKLDKVVDSLERLVRLEEKHISIERRLEGAEGRQDTHAKRLAAVESDLRTRGVIGGKVERFGWIIVSAVVGAFTYLLRG